jgi:hypothetical protein
MSRRTGEQETSVELRADSRDRLLLRHCSIFSLCENWSQRDANRTPSCVFNEFRGFSVTLTQLHLCLHELGHAGYNATEAGANLSGLIRRSVYRNLTRITPNTTESDF